MIPLGNNFDMFYFQTCESFCSAETSVNMEEQKLPNGNDVALPPEEGYVYSLRSPTSIDTLFRYY